MLLAVRQRAWGVAWLRGSIGFLGIGAPRTLRSVLVRVVTDRTLMPRSVLWTVADQLTDECRASPDGGQEAAQRSSSGEAAQRSSSGGCDNFLYAFKGVPPARQRRASARLSAVGRGLAERESVN